MSLDNCTHANPIWDRGKCATQEECDERDRFKRNAASISFSSMRPRAEELRQRDKAFDKDAAAYKRLRAEGYQPKGVNRSAELEARANHKVEIELGKSLDTHQVKAFNRGMGAID